MEWLVVIKIDRIDISTVALIMETPTTNDENALVECAVMYTYIFGWAFSIDDVAKQT